MSIVTPGEDSARQRLRKALQRAPLFADLESHSMAAVERELSLLVLPGGAPLFRQGEPADAVYVVASGCLGQAFERRSRAQNLESALLRLRQLERALRPAIERFGMRTTLIDEARKKRLVIMVSKFDHAMLHLLYQIRVGWLDVGRNDALPQACSWRRDSPSFDTCYCVHDSPPNCLQLCVSLRGVH